MLADVCARFDDQLLVFAVNELAHALDEQAFGVALEDGIPLAAPEDLDDVPSSTTEGGFEFLNNLTVAAHRAVETLQVAVHYENQIVEFFARRKRDGTERFRLVGFAVAEESPDFCVGGRFQAAVFEIAAEAGLINGHQRAEPHRDGGKFPEVGHQPRVRIRRETAAGFQFAAKIFQLLRGDAAFQKGASVDAGRGVSLEVNGVALEFRGTGAEEMVEADFVERSGTGVGRDVAADIVLDAIGAYDHGEGVPANEALDA